uniref:Uncharacterized protein n=1 Tax=Panagrolaimus sp. PS1159 TaxID=55785 RepID=A0AC35GK57_9BILA
MKLCFKILFCFYVVLSLECLDASNDSLILGENVHDDQFDGLLSDGSVTAIQEDKDIRLSGYGQINLTLDDGQLELAVCKGCVGKSTVCYESVIGLSDPKAAGTCFESSCMVKIEGNDETIIFGGEPFYTELLTGCITSTMNYKFAKVESSDNSNDIKSCRPKIVGADKMVKLFVNIEHGCSVTVINAKIHAPPTTTTSTKMPPPTQSSQKGSAEASPFPDWAYAVIGIVILIVILIIGFVVYYLYRKRQTSKRIPPNVDGRKSKSTKAKDTTVETPIQKNDKNKTIERATTEDIPAPTAKIEPKKIQKKATQEPTTAEDVPAPIQKPKMDKKPKTPEPTTAEDVPAPTVTQQEPRPNPPKQLPPPNPAACYPL